MLFTLGAFLLSNGRKPEPATRKLSVNSDAAVNPLDTVSSTDIAQTVANITKLPEATAVYNQADSADLNAVNGANNDSEITSKPQVVTTGLKSKADIRIYTSQPGDTIASIAAKFNVTSDSVRWSNNLNGDSVTAGKQLQISPISDGIVYKVEAGDSPDSLAKKFQARKDKIVAFNDAEIAGLTVGELIVIPGGNLPAAAPSYSAVANLGGGFAWGGNAAVYGSNGYDYGQCTYWVSLRRQQTGNPIPSNLGNAITWVSLAQKAGLSTGNTPRKGAVIWTPPNMLSGYYAQYGHVGFVEDVLPDGTVKVSDMNVKGWNVISSRTLTPERASAYSYIY